jgi:predicted amidophosphoribosyltransferase
LHRNAGRDTRQTSLTDAFTSRIWHGEHIAIIDDVLTTGATAHALANTLLTASASEVRAWCATRTPEPRAARNTGNRNMPG